MFFRNGRNTFLSSIKENSVSKTSKMEGKPSLLIVNNKDEFDKEARELQVYAIVVADGKPKKVAKILGAI